MNIFFCYKLDNFSGWGTLSLNYISKFESSSSIVFCNKKNKRLLNKQYSILRNPILYLKNPFLFFMDSLKIIKILKTLYIGNKDLNIHILVEPYIFFLFFIKNFFKKKIFYSQGTYSYYFCKSFKWKFLFKFLISRIDIIIFVSSYIKNKFKENISIKKISNIILNPYIVTKTPNIFNNNNHNNTLRILSVGAIKERKGYFQLIKIISNLIKKYKIRVNLTIVGKINDNSYYEIMTKFINNNKLNKFIKIKINVSKLELTKIYRNSDLFMLLSKDYKYNLEGFGIVYLEALSQGCEIIISKESGAKDLRKFSRKINLYNPKNLNNISTLILGYYKSRLIDRKSNISLFNKINFKNGMKLEAFSKKFN
jgi:glycosyltransferase involved in cell wall biosynthesis